MLKTVKKKMKVWKYAFIAPVIVAMFIVIACQEQVMDDLNTVVQNSSVAVDVPEEIQNVYEDLKRENPNSQYVMLELNEDGRKKLEEMESKYGAHQSVVVFAVGDSQNSSSYGPIYYAKGEKEGNKFIKNLADGSEKKRTIAIIEFNDQVRTLSENTTLDGDIFTIVEETAQPKEGIENFYAFIINNMKYPREAREQGIEGRVFIEFVIEKDGSLTNLKVLKGIGHGCDDEAMRVLAMSPPWNPGRQRGLPVRQKMVMPIIFNSGQATTGSIESQVLKMIVETRSVQEADGKMQLMGQVKDESGNPIKGAHVIAKGQTYGTTTDDNGMFQLMSDKKVPLVISFVGYKSEEIGYD